MGNDDFVGRIHTEFIPRIKKMITEETGHRKWLMVIHAPESFISESTDRIRGLEKSLIEYINYEKHDDNQLDNNGVE